MIFYTGCEKNMSFLEIPNSPKVGEKVEKIGLGFLNVPMTNVLEVSIPVPGQDVEAAPILLPSSFRSMSYIF